jgi:hypothetical protein
MQMGKCGIRACLGGLLILSWSAAFGADFETDLNGFRLWQYKSGAEDYFGKPQRTVEQEGFTAEVYGITDKSFMAFQSLKERFAHNIFSIQITGYPTRMVPFHGVVLGDSIEKAEKMLGKPDERRPVSDTPYTLNIYEGANFSTEYDDKGKLHSIRMSVTKKFMESENFGGDTWETFTTAIREKDFRKLLPTLRPDFEIYKNNETIAVNRRFLDFMNSPDKQIIELLFGDKNSVRAAFEQSDPYGEMRLIQGVGVGQVFKFYDGDIVKEIVLFPYNGEYRVYEIAFGKAGPKPAIDNDQDKN